MVHLNLGAVLIVDAMITGPELGSLLEEQRAYYRALARDYPSQGLDLPVAAS